MPGDAIIKKQADSLRQLALALPETSPRYDAGGFVHSEANDAAWRIARGWAASDEPALIICGPPKSGKTYLAHLIADGRERRFVDPVGFSDALAEAPMVIIDGLPAHDPRGFLAVLESDAAASARVILTGAGHPSEWSMGLKDLRTRLEAMPRAVMNEPDESLIRAVIAKGFRDRQVTVSPAVVDFAAPRLPRTFAAAHGFVAIADRAALAQKRKISVALVQKLIDELSDTEFTA